MRTDVARCFSVTWARRRHVIDIAVFIVVIRTAILLVQPIADLFDEATVLGAIRVCRNLEKEVGGVEGLGTN